MPKNEARRELKTDLAGIAMVTFALLGITSLIVTEVNGELLSGQAIGAFGRFLVRSLSGLFGKGKYVFLLVFGYLGFKTFQDYEKERLARMLIGFGIIFCVLLTLLHFPLIGVHRDFLPLVKAGLAGDGGGLVGGTIAFVFDFCFGPYGSYIILAALGAAALLFIRNVSFAEVVKRWALKVGGFFGRLKHELVDFLFYEVEPDEDNENLKKNALPESKPLIIDHMISTADAKSELEASDEEGAHGPKKKEHTKKSDTASGHTAWDESLKKNGNSPSEDYEGFALPPLELFKKPLQIKKSRIDKDITDKVRLLEQTLASFGVKVKVTQVSCGPAITRYEIQPAQGVKVSRIVSLADDIALSLAAPDVRIEAPIPGKAALGIEVPNKEVALVYFREVLESQEFTSVNYPLAVALGKDIAGNTVVANLRDMPHLLVAGATGSGKSVCMNTLISSLLFRNKPDQLKLMIIDPKMVELTNYNGIPHLISPVVTEPKKAATALRWIVKEMEHRYATFAKNGVRDIHRFNDLAGSNSDFEPLPLIVVLIDELADLMMVAPTDVEDCICRLAQMARAAGIHLVVATQRPSVDVITGLIKANIPSRIAFSVSSQIDSRTILDVGGAEKLLGRGDMLFHPVGASKPIRVQGALISDKEVESLVNFLRNQGSPSYEDDLIHTQKEVQEEEGDMHDDLLPNALELCIEQGHASISLIQRRLHIGYTRAARLIDLMEQSGYIGPYEGSKPRKMLLTRQQFEEMFKEHSS